MDCEDDIKEITNICLVITRQTGLLVAWKASSTVNSAGDSKFRLSFPLFFGPHSTAYRQLFSYFIFFSLQLLKFLRIEIKNMFLKNLILLIPFWAENFRNVRYRVETNAWSSLFIFLDLFNLKFVSTRVFNSTNRVGFG